MLLSVVPIDDEHVPALAEVLNPVLAEKLNSREAVDAAQQRTL